MPGDKTPGPPKEVKMEQLTPTEKDRLAQERVRIANSRADDAKVVDPTVRVRFQNMEDPPQPGKPSPALSFVYGQYVFKESRGPEDGEDTALRDGKEYDLPMSVVDHLNGLRIPTYGKEIDPTTKALRSVISGYRNRFSCVPVNMGKYTTVEKPPQAKIKRGRPPKKKDIDNGKESQH